MNRTAALYVVMLVARWLARLAGVLMIGLFILLAVGEGPPPLRVWVSPIMLGMLTAMAGMVVGWWREGLGGTIVVAAGVGMYAYHLLVWHRWLGGAFPFFFVPGILLLLSYCSSRLLSRSTSLTSAGSLSQAKLPQ